MTTPGQEFSAVASTSAGMCALWQPEHFWDVVDVDDWDDKVGEDESLLAAMAEGAFVPLNVGGDGAFQVLVRYPEESGGGLTAREARYRLVSSDEYLFVSRGLAVVGGLEAVGGTLADPSLEIPLTSGRYAVKVHLIDWKADSDSIGADGKPNDNALPDLVVEVAPETSTARQYRASVETFDRP